MLALLFGCGAGPVRLSKEWRQVELESTELTAPYLLIDYGRSDIRFNGRPLKEAQILDPIREAAPLVPRPLVFIRFSLNHKAAAYALARKIGATGICDEGGCMYRIVGH